MEIKRFFLNSTVSRREGDRIFVCGDTFVHLTVVLRAKIGYKVIVCFNDGKELDCTIVSIDKSSAVLSVDNERVVDTRRHKVTLYAALLKNQKLDYVVQKAVELGVDTLVPYFSKRTVETRFNLERSRTIALESAQQCGSAFLTEIQQLHTFEQVLAELKQYDQSLIAYEEEDRLSLSAALKVGVTFALLIGPEGGFEKDEVKSAQDNGACAVTLGKRILRADTASIVSSALLLNELGDLDYDD